MRTRFGLALLLGVALVLLLALLLRSPVAQKQGGVTTNTSPAAIRLPTNDAPAPPIVAETNSVPVPPVLISELNHFITLTKPYGLDGPIKMEDVIYFTNSHKTHMMVETKTHIATFFGYKLSQLLATYDSSNPVALPEAKKEATKKWYMATAKWTNEEALAETQEIMQKLGIEGVRWESTNVEPFTITVRNPLGERVTVTPFYKVELEAAHQSLRAEFRMGESGPGRLTDWSMWPPMPK